MTRGAQRPNPHSPSPACGRGRGPLRSNGKVRGRSPTSPICRRGAAQRAFSGTTESSRSPHPPTLRVGPSHNPFDRSAIEPSRGRPQSGRPGCARKRERGLTDAVRISPSPACGRGRGPLRSNGKVRGRMPASLICRSSIAQRAQDGVLHAFGIAENVVVPEAQYPPPAGFEPRGPTRVDGATQTKSAMNGPSRCWRRNLKPRSRRPRKADHSRRSASVMVMRSSRARDIGRNVTWAATPPHLPVAAQRAPSSPAGGRGAGRTGPQVAPLPRAGTTRPTALRSAPGGFDRRAIERVVGGTREAGG